MAGGIHPRLDQKAAQLLYILEDGFPGLFG